MLRHLRRPAAALPGRGGPPAGPLRRRHGRHPARPRASTGRSSAPSTRPTAVVVTVVRLVHGPARHRGRRRSRSRRSPSTPPRAAPPAACAATASSRARTPSSLAWAGPAPGPGRRGQRCAVDLPEADRPARRLRRARAASRSPPSPGRVAAPVAPRRRCGRLRTCSLARTSRSPARPPPSLARARPRRVLGRRVRRRTTADGPTPEEVLAPRPRHARRDQRRQAHPGHRRPARRRLRHRQGGTASAPTRPAFEGTHHRRLRRPDRRRPGHRRRRHGLRPAPVHPGWDTVDPDEYGAPDPADADRRRRASPACSQQTESSRRARASAAATTTTRSSPTYTGTVPGDGDGERHPDRRSGDSFDASTDHRRRRAARGHAHRASSTPRPSR